MTVALEPSRSLTFRAGALLVRGAGAMVPPRRRSEWRREWEAELWYAVAAPGRGGRLSLADRLGLVARCLGAYQHAAWLCARQLRHRRLRVRVGVAVRDLRAEPRPGILALTSVALTVGAAGLLFGVAQQARHRVLPAPGGDRIVRVFNSAPAADLDRTGISGYELARFRARNRSFEGLAAFRQLPPSMGMRAAGIAPEFLPLLRVAPASGRNFVAADYEPGAEPVALAREDAGLRLGATLVVAGVRHTVVGTIPATLRFPRADTRAWIPLATDSGLDALGERNVGVIGRLRSSASPASAARELTALSSALQSEHPEGYLGPFGVAWSVVVEPAGTPSGDSVLLAGLLLIGATLLGVAASCAAAGFVSRRTAMAWVLPVGIGGAIGWAMATLALRVLRPVGSVPDGIGVAAVAIAITMAALVSAQLVGRGRRRRASGSRSAPGLALCMAASVVLLASAVAMAGAYRQLARRGPGFDPVGLLALRLPSGADSAVVARVARVTGVEGVARTGELPVLESAPAATFEIEGAVPGRGPAPSAEVQGVDANYFAVARIPLLAGRTFSPVTDGPPMEAVVNRTLAGRFFGAGAAIGRRLVVHLGPGRPSGWLTVVGIAADVRRGGTDRRSVAELYLPQSASTMPASALVVRAAPFATAAAAAELEGLGQPLSFDRAVRAGLEPYRVAASLLAICALVMGLVTVLVSFAASGKAMIRAALSGAAAGACIVAFGAPGLARLPSLADVSGIGLGVVAAGASLALVLPAILRRRRAVIVALRRASPTP